MTRHKSAGKVRRAVSRRGGHKTVRLNKPGAHSFVVIDPVMQGELEIQKIKMGGKPRKLNMINRAKHLKQ